jgi:hypothetical protein
MMFEVEALYGIEFVVSQPPRIRAADTNMPHHRILILPPVLFGSRYATA